VRGREREGEQGTGRSVPIALEKEGEKAVAKNKEH
jgi:hypothetical protein